jgi:pimeloyl-ACP methyl ester carboxylesterase
VIMNRPLAIIATVLSVLALYLPTRTQAFTRVIVDGRSIRMLVAGRGHATVVFENGAGPPLEMWGRVQPDVSEFARTVTYDRAGVGLSDAWPLPRDSRRIAAELRQALLLAGIGPPYILVGASFGGPYIRIFAGMYPDDVAGLVLVDPTTDNQLFDDAASVPVLSSWRETLAQSRASRVPSGLPVFLIDAVSPLEVPFATEAVRTLRMNNRPEIEADSLEYRRWLDGIPGSRLIVTNRSGHNVPLEQPELVVATIREAVEAFGSSLK